MPADLHQSARAALGRYFGFPDFRPVQARVVASVIAARDTLAILPTGGGKSVCFQVPALVRPGLTLVVSPLIALMQDQVSALAARSIPAASLTSHMDRAAQETIVRRAREGSVRLLYLSPERAPRAAAELAGIPVGILAVDEAHCISEWGHDFRPAYRRLREFRQSIGRPPVVALTGSATPAVATDIVTSLGMSRPVIHRSSFDRPNLRFEVETVRDIGDRLRRVVAELYARPGLAIVYVPTRNLADGVARRLRFASLRAAPYHAALSRERRAETLTRFTGGDLDVVVATSAFGMGIDVAAVRLVLHWGIPPTPEAYYQEAGRAGRDGERSRCVLLHHPADADLHRRQLAVTFPDRALLERIWTGRQARSRIPREILASADRLSGELGRSPNRADWTRVGRRRKAAEARISAIERYAAGRGCRRATLLGYFGEAPGRCAGCDRCR
jgi:ATP-dependent DNA helicase RecQ